MQKMERKRTLYIDLIKAAAICGVLVDHFRYLFPNPDLAGYISYFSVSSFVIVAGITTYRSMPRQVDKILGGGGYCKYRLKGLFCTYFVACFCLYAFLHGGEILDIHDFFVTLISFNLPGASYYVIVYAQLIFISPLVYVLVQKIMNKRFPSIWMMLFMAAALCVGYLFTMKGVTLAYYGGAKYLLCGSYLSLFVFGMAWEVLDIPAKIMRIKFVNLLAPLCAFAALKYGIHRGWTTQPFTGWYLNPPSTVLMLYAVAVVWCISAFVLHCEKIEWMTRYILRPVSVIGRYTLDIFLFHNLVHYVVLSYLPQVIPEGLKRVLLYIIPVLLPMAGRKGYTSVKKWVYDNLKCYIKSE